MVDVRNGGGVRRGIREQLDDDLDTQSNRGLITGERTKVRLNISRLFAQRDDLLERASANTRKRTQLQKELVALDDEVSHTADSLFKAQVEMHRREDEIVRLRRRIELLEQANMADKQALQVLADRIAGIKDCVTFKVGQLVRYITPCASKATRATLHVICLAIGQIVPIIVTLVIGF